MPSRVWLLPSLGLALILVQATTPAAEARWPRLVKAAAGQSDALQDAAVIVAIESYRNVPPVPGAIANGKAWYSYLRKTRSVPFVKLLQNEAANEIAIPNAIREARARLGKGGTLWFVFIGHGAPARDGKDGILVGVDASQDPELLYARSVSRKVVLDELTQGSHARSVAFFDTCFSGRTGPRQALAQGLQPLLPVASEGMARPRAIVLTAGQADQFAGPLPKGGNVPAFSYLALGGLRGWADRNQDGTVTARELHTYVESTLTLLLDGRSQTPELWTSSPLAELTRGKQLERGPDLDALALDLAQQGQARQEPVVAEPPKTAESEARVARERQNRLEAQRRAAQLKTVTRITSSAIQGQIQAHRANLRKCTRGQSFQSRIKLTVSGSGRVTSVRYKQPPDRTAQICLNSVLTQIHFPAFRSSSTVTVSTNLSI